MTGIGCSRSAKEGDGGEPALPEGRHALTGTVVSISAERGTLLVDHEEIPGYMPAMTMEFKVNAGDLANATAGDRIHGVMYEGADGFHLEQIWPLDLPAHRVVDDAAQALRQDTVTRGTSAYREVGESLPDFALYDQNGEVAGPERFRGRQIVLNFIFTRCPDPNMCPLSTAKMMQVQQLAAESGIDNLQLISVTLDPAYDTPGVLREFADLRGIDTSNFSFLTGPERAIKDLLLQMGVHAFQNGPLIQHTLATLLIDDTGRIVHRFDGSGWKPEDFVMRMKRGDDKSG